MAHTRYLICTLCVTLISCIWGHNIRVILCDLDDVLIGNNMTTYIANTLHNTPGKPSAHIIPEAHQIINKIQQDNYHRNDIVYCIFSNASRNHFAKLIENPSMYALWKQFDYGYFLWNLNLAKPRTEAYRFITHQLHVHPHECLLIDDNRYNVASAQCYGMHGIQFNRYRVPDICHKLRQLHLIY